MAFLYSLFHLLEMVLLLSDYQQVGGSSETITKQWHDEPFDGGSPRSDSLEYSICTEWALGQRTALFALLFQNGMASWYKTINNRACQCFVAIFLKVFWVTFPGENELSPLTCNLTAPFVILHNCCHPGKTKLFFSLVNSPTLVLEPLRQHRL